MIIRRQKPLPTVNRLAALDTRKRDRVAEAKATWAKLIAKSVDGEELDADECEQLGDAAEVLGVETIEAAFNGDVAIVRQLRLAEKQLAESHPPRPGDVVADELVAAEERVRLLRIEKNRLACWPSIRAGLRSEMNQLRQSAPERIANLLNPN